MNIPCPLAAIAHPRSGLYIRLFTDLHSFRFCVHVQQLLVLSGLIHARAGRTSPAGERGSAAGSLPSSRRPEYTRLGLRVVQAITRVALLLCMVLRLV